MDYPSGTEIDAPMPVDNGLMAEQKDRALWRRTRRVTAVLLAVWVLANLAGPWFARAVDGLHFAGLPLGYWLASQGLLLLYLLIILLYVVYMKRAEARFHHDGQASTAPRVSE